MNGLGFDECLRLIVRKGRGSYFLLSPVSFHSYQCYLASAQRIKFPRFFFSLHRTRKMSMVPTVHTSTILPTTHSLLGLQEFLRQFPDLSVSFFVSPWFPTSCFLCLECLPNLIVFPPLTLPKPCANVSSLDCLLFPLPNSSPSSIFQSRLQEQFLLYSLLAIAIIYF